jgi:hypothetical protein
MFDLVDFFHVSLRPARLARAGIRTEGWCHPMPEDLKRRQDLLAESRAFGVQLPDQRIVCVFAERAFLVEAFRNRSLCLLRGLQKDRI